MAETVSTSAAPSRPGRAMMKAAVFVEKNRIVQAEPIKSFGSFEVKCKFGYGIDGTVQLLVIEK